MAIDPRYITDFNRVRLVFVGHYQNICENPASTSLWLDVSKSSALKLRFQTLPVKTSCRTSLSRSSTAAIIGR